MSYSNNKVFFRIGKLDTNIDEVEYKSLIIDLFDKYASIDIDPDNIRLVENREFGGYQRFSFVTLNEGDDLDAVLSAFDKVVTQEGYDLVASKAEDKKREGGFSGGSHGGGSKNYNNNRDNRGGGRRY